MRRIIAASLGLSLAAVGCTESPTGLDELPETAETVEAAVNLAAIGTFYVIANCSGTPTVNCPGGGGANPAPVTVTRDSILVTPSGTPGTFFFSAWVHVVTPADIPIGVLGADCGLAINTAPGTNNNVEISGSALFTRQLPDDPINRLELTNLTLTGLEDADVTLHGNATCAAANLSTSLFLDMLTNMLASQTTALCGAPGPELLGPCPARPAVARLDAVTWPVAARRSPPRDTALHPAPQAARASRRASPSSSRS